MKIGLICTTVVSLLCATGLAAAQAPSPATRVTKDYTESTNDGGAVVKFGDDALPGDVNNPWGDLVKAPPRVVKLQLIRPRMNFLPELYKSVENL